MKFFYQIRRSLQEIVSLVQRILQKMVAFDRVTLQKHHLLKVANTSMRHLSAFRRCSCSKIVAINNCAIKSSACSIEHNSGAICTTTDDQKIELSRTILQSFQMLVSCLHLEIILDLLVFFETVEGFRVELSAQYRVNQIVSLGLGLALFET